MHHVSYYALMSLTVHELFTPSDVYFVSIISTRLQAKAIAHAVPDSWPSHSPSSGHAIPKKKETVI